MGTKKLQKKTHPPPPTHTTETGPTRRPPPPPPLHPPSPLPDPRPSQTWNWLNEEEMSSNAWKQAAWPPPAFRSRLIYRSKQLGRMENTNLLTSGMRGSVWSALEAAWHWHWYPVYAVNNHATKRQPPQLGRRLGQNTAAPRTDSKTS